MKKTVRVAAKTLPIYERAIARYPHLAIVTDAKTFCFNLCRLATVPNINAAEYFRIAAVANGEAWRAEKEDEPHAQN